jgi:Reverse transcriptase (RNA-dependent DNA polymerase)
MTTLIERTIPTLRERCGWSKYYCHALATRLRPPEDRDPISSIMAPYYHSEGRTVPDQYAVTASTDTEIDTAFATAVDAHADGLLVSDWPFFTVRHGRIAELASRHRLPTIYGWREYVAAGGLISYGSRLTEGTPQGGPLSPLLSNLVLDELDRELERRGHRFVRYADDCAPRRREGEVGM